jgi:hydroxymethylbilane synthase
MTEWTLRLATRKSKLALAQARAYATALCDAHQGLTIEEVHIVTSGDKFQDRPLQAIGGKGLFIKEIEQALLDGAADLAVHSIKDVPAELAEGLTMAAIPVREDPRDVLVTRDGGGLASLARGAKVGTSSLRRKTMLLAQRPDLDVQPLRGNVDTRLGKLEDGQIDAIVLAFAGLKRLGLAERASEVLAPEVMLPAVGQGALGIECRGDDERVRALLKTSDHAETRTRITAERAFMAAVGGNCQLPVAAYATRDGDHIWLRAFVADDDGARPRTRERRSAWPRADADAAIIGRELGEALRG